MAEELAEVEEELADMALDEGPGCVLFFSVVSGQPRRLLALFEICLGLCEVPL